MGIVGKHIVDLCFVKICDNETMGEMKRKEEEEIRIKEEDFGASCFGRLRKFFWNLTEYPESGKPAQVS